MSNRPLRILASLAAWLFTLGTIAALAHDIGWPPIRPAAVYPDTFILHATIDGHPYYSWGLTYTGEKGQRLRLAQFAALTAAAILSLLPQNTLRRIGLLALLAWPTLWLANSLRMTWLAPIWVFIVISILLALFFAATLARTRMAWTRPAPDRLIQSITA